MHAQASQPEAMTANVGVDGGDEGQNSQEFDDDLDSQPRTPTEEA